MSTEGMKSVDILEKIADLHVQATREKSHYYTASVLREALEEIRRLRRRIALMSARTPPHKRN